MNRGAECRAAVRLSDAERLCGNGQNNASRCRPQKPMDLMRCGSTARRRPEANMLLAERTRTAQTPPGM